MGKISASLGFADAPFATALAGRSMPDVKLGRSVNGNLETIATSDLFVSTRDVVLGVPGAFTPSCTNVHLPEYVSNAVRLRQAGYQNLYCIVPNNAWITAKWAREVDPRGQITFLADGNLDFVRALGLITRADAAFLGETSQRYLMTVDGRTIERVKIEQELRQVSCTRTDTLLI